MGIRKTARNEIEGGSYQTLFSRVEPQGNNSK